MEDNSKIKVKSNADIREIKVKSEAEIRHVTRTTKQAIKQAKEKKIICSINPRKKLDTERATASLKRCLC